MGAVSSPTEELHRLAGHHQVALALLDYAEIYIDPASDIERANAAADATTIVGRFNDTRALERFYELAEAVDGWHRYDYAPASADLASADDDVVTCLFRLIHGQEPCRESLRNAWNVTQLHARAGLFRCSTCTGKQVTG